MCEVHIPLLTPQDYKEIVTLWRVMSKKNKIELADGALPTVSADRQLSGADLESILLSARRRALLDGRARVEQVDLATALDEFIPSAEGLEKELQEIAAVLECTDRRFLPAPWAEKIAPRDGRAQLQERLSAIRTLLNEV